MTLTGERPRRFGQPLVWIDEAESTNDVARSLADAGVSEGAVVVARRQTRGRGRRSRAWVSPPGGLWVTLLLRPAGSSGWGRLMLAVAVAAAEAVEACAGIRVGIRWPNDLVVGGRKVGGVLAEAGGGAVLVGVGINANVPLEALPADLADRATSLHLVCGCTQEIAGLLRCLLSRLEAWYDVWLAGGAGAVEAFNLRDAIRGTRVVVGEGDAAVEGVADGVDEDGALRVRQPGGAVSRVVAGDLVPVPDAGRPV
jgi:BirA family biotin operon repressor/biotin-[acetyl-CoA-carboxylase] ligase